MTIQSSSAKAPCETVGCYSCSMVVVGEEVHCSQGTLVCVCSFIFFPFSSAVMHQLFSHCCFGYGSFSPVNSATASCYLPTHCHCQAYIRQWGPVLWWHPGQSVFLCTRWHSPDCVRLRRAVGPIVPLGRTSMDSRLAVASLSLHQPQSCYVFVLTFGWFGHLCLWLVYFVCVCCIYGNHIINATNFLGYNTKYSWDEKMVQLPGSLPSSACSSIPCSIRVIGYLSNENAT